MKFSYNILQENISKKLPKPDKLAGLLTMHSFEVEGVEKVKGDYILDVDVLPNRAHDACGHRGLAREAAALTGLDLKHSKLPGLKKQKKEIKGLKIEVDNPSLCSRYIGALVKNVEVKESPQWLKDRLEALGINPINNIVDAANYAMVQTGQPLHAFDYDKIAGFRTKKILVRNAKKGEIVQTLDDEAYILDKSDLVISDEKDALAIAGIKGGRKAEVDTDTKHIVVESANFDSLTIRKTSQKLGLKTDASYRFEHKIPSVFAEEGLLYFLHLLGDLAGGEVQQDSYVDTLKNEPQKTVLKLRPEYVESMLGVRVDVKKIVSILKSLEFEVEKDGTTLKVTPPAFRLDVEREENLVEEVGRVFGYENISPETPNAALYPPEQNPIKPWMEHINTELTGAGYTEVYNYSFVGEELHDWGFKEHDLWELKNPTSEDYKYMRPLLLPGMLGAAVKNLRFSDSVLMYEAGKIFKKETAGAREELRLSIIRSAKNKNNEIFYELKGDLIKLLEGLGLSNVYLDDSFSKKDEEKYSFLHPHRKAYIKTGNKTLGFIGGVHPKIGDKNKLKGTFYACELLLEEVIKEADAVHSYKPASIYPEVVRDISVLVPQSERIGGVMHAIGVTGGKLLADIEMFDYYEGGDSGKKSVAFRLTFKSEDKTLKSDEVDSIMQKINYVLEQEKGWEIR